MIHSVSIAEFDIDEGNTLSCIHPADAFDCSALSLNFIADHCLPDGAHAFASDCAYFVFTRDEFYSPEYLAAHSDTLPAELYGFACFLNVRTDAVRRGAIQKSIVVISSYRMTDLFMPIYKAAVERFIENPMPEILQAVYDAVQAAIVRQLTSITLFSHLTQLTPFSMHVVLPSKDEWTQVSVKSLIETFGTDVLLIRSALNLRCRIMVVGTPASDVCNAVLAALFVYCSSRSPAGHEDQLRSPVPLCPYICLGDMDRVLSLDGFLFGSTNRLFEEHKEWTDCLVSLDAQKVYLPEPRGKPSRAQEIRKGISSADRRLLRLLVEGVRDEKRSESWVRSQLPQLSFDVEDSSVTTPGLTSPASISPFSPSSASSTSSLRHRFSSTRDRDVESIVNELRMHGSSLGQLDRRKLLFDLYTKCVANVPTQGASTAHEQLQSPGTMGSHLGLTESTPNFEVPLACIVPFLRDTSAQVRKYAFSLLSPLAAVEVLDELITGLSDPMTNVANAAAAVVVKLSESITSARMLGAHVDAVDVLLCALLNVDADVEFRTRAATILLNIFQSCSVRSLGIGPLPVGFEVGQRYFGCAMPNMMTLSRIQDTVSSIRMQGASRLYDAALLLLDEWGCNLDGLMTADRAHDVMRDLTSHDKDLQTSAASLLFNSLMSNRLLLLQCLHADLVNVVTLCFRSAQMHPHLSRFLLGILTISLDTGYGEKKVLPTSVLPNVVRVLKTTKSPVLLFSTVKFLAQCCSHASLAYQFVKLDGVSLFCDLLATLMDVPSLSHVCLACVYGLWDLVLGNIVSTSDILGLLRAAAEKEGCSESYCVSVRSNCMCDVGLVSKETSAAPEAESIPEEVLEAMRRRRMKSVGTGRSMSVFSTGRHASISMSLSVPLWKTSLPSRSQVHQLQVRVRKASHRVLLDVFASFLVQLTRGLSP